jgi:phosphatidylserine/phosphatidylglycerophosphate/cardiolipin synthase-like enzyme
VSRRTISIISIALALVLILGIGIFALTRHRGGPAIADESETTVSRGTPLAQPSGTVTGIGSGGSTRGSWYELHFTAPVYPDNPANHKDGLDVHLVALMDKATKTLDVADYDFDLANVADAMVRAKKRGVTVRMVTDTDTLTDKKNKEIQDAFGKLKGVSIPIVDDQRGPIMHNKFTVVDSEWVETGSWNYTDGDTYHLNNNQIIIHNPQLAQNYAAEFTKMFEKRTFGPNKAKGVPYPTVNIEGTHIENYFAAEDDTVGNIVRTINGAKQSIHFLAFSFTQDDIGQAIIAKQKAGVAVGGVFETTGSNVPTSEYGKMKKAGLDVYTDGNPWVMHHKVIVIDDHITIFGSFNFSDNAAHSNDENLLIVDNADIAKAFNAEYDRVLALAKNPPAKKK